MYRKILVPLDGSEFSECIVEHVKAVAGGCQAPEVVLMRVIEPLSPQLYGITEGFRKEAQSKATSAAEDYLAKLADNLQQAGIAASTAVIQGEPADEILKYTGQNQVDLIMMSTHGFSGVSRWAFGSVTDRVVRHAMVPVLVASPPGCRVHPVA